MRRLVLLCLAFVLAGTACGELLDPAAAVVNGEKITVDEIGQALERFEGSSEFERLAQQGDAQELKRQVEQQLLSQEIRRAVLEPKAEALGIEVTEDDVDEQLEQIKSDFPSAGAFEETLKEQGLTLEQLRELVRDNLLEEQLRAEVTKDSGPTEEDLQAYFEENREQFQQVEAQHILVDEKATADQLARRLQAAPGARVDALFARLAEEFSTDPSGKNGGDLGTSSPGEYVPPFRDALNELEVGEISDPVKSQFGFHVIRLNDRIEPTFEEVADQIEEELGAGATDRAWEQYVAEAYDEAEVKVNPRYGEFDEETFQVIDPTAEDVPGAEEQEEAPATPGPGEPPAEEPPAEEPPAEEPPAP